MLFRSEALWVAGWYYGDVSAGNLMLEEGGRLRVVDGGSAVPAAAEVFPTGYTPAFTTPRLFAALSQGRPVAPSGVPQGDGAAAAL